MPSLAKVGEFAFIDAIARLVSGSSTRRGVKVGIGDDAAVVAGFRSTLLTTDALVEEVHFRRSWMTPRALGRRAFRVTVSDISAMGGVSRYVLLSLVLPPSCEVSAARGLVAGLVADADAAGTALVGGNVSAGDRLSLHVTLVGEADGNGVCRSGARAGHDVFLTGPVGAAAAGVELLESGVVTGALVEAYRRPPLRLELGRALARGRAVGAMIDVSDGVAQDLAHICAASRVHAVVDPQALPITTALRRSAAANRRRLKHPPLHYALAGGEDYELMFTAPPAKRHTLAAVCARHGAGLYRIGHIARTGDRAAVTDPAGRDLGAYGYTHFRSDLR